MAQAAATKFDATINKVEIIESNKLKRAEVWGESDKAVHWAGAFAVYGGHGATASSTIVYEIEPGKRLGGLSSGGLIRKTPFLIENTRVPMDRPDRDNVLAGRKNVMIVSRHWTRRQALISGA